MFRAAPVAKLVLPPLFTARVGLAVPGGGGCPAHHVTARALRRRGACTTAAL